MYKHHTAACLTSGHSEHKTHVYGGGAKEQNSHTDRHQRQKGKSFQE